MQQNPEEVELLDVLAGIPQLNIEYLRTSLWCCLRRSYIASAGIPDQQDQQVSQDALNLDEQMIKEGAESGIVTLATYDQCRIRQQLDY